ncbi:hypothetical protein BN1723_010919 [Verticillium longisporum]|uniref:ribonuclease Z n=1 Tax=Verticillium longisporum TaxID=100787 RepID=A0A0G4L3I9_VERLO|nr:hypothetical protein BN1723_010919 [Verticillium longisporum]
MDGKDVTPDMVLEAPMKGQGFAVLAIPSLEHAPGFLERPEWQSDELLDNVQIFYWIFGRGVFDDPSIQEFIKSKPHVRHLVMGPDISPNMITYESYAALFTKLHRLDPARFPGTQRAISQRGHSLAKLDKIFIAGEVNWETTGGMLGMMLTVADGLAAVAQDVKNSNEARRKEGKREIATPNKTFEIFGGKNTAHTVATARNFIFRTGMPIKAVDLTLDPRAAGGSPTPHDYSKPDWEDDTILVWHVPVARSRPATAAAAAEAATAAGTDTRLGSQSPRARSRSASPPRKRQQMAENTVHDIVENMFNSDWSKDGLFETKLADVQMPAKIFIRENGNIKKYDGPTPSTRDVVVPDITVLVRKPWPSAMVTDLPPTTMSDTSLCYVVKNRGRRGKLNPKVAIDLGVAKPDFKRLTAGETVKAMDGKDVTPDMVLEAPMKGQGMGARRVLLTHFSQRYAKIPLVEQKIEAAEAGPEAEAKAKDQVVLMAFDQMQVRLGEFRHAAAFLPALRRFFEVEEETKEAEKEKAKEAHEAVEKKRKK